MLDIIKNLSKQEINDLDIHFNEIKSLGQALIHNYEFVDIVTEFLDYVGIKYSKQWIISQSCDTTESLGSKNYWLIKKV